MWPITADDTMTGLPGNRLSPCRHWQFGLSTACATELVVDFYRYLHGNRSVRCCAGTATHTKGSRHNASPGNPRDYGSTYLRSILVKRHAPVLRRSYRFQIMMKV